MYRLTALPSGLSGVRPISNARVDPVRPLRPLLFTRRRQQSSSSSSVEARIADDSPLADDHTPPNGVHTTTDSVKAREERGRDSMPMIDHHLPPSLHGVDRSSANANPDPLSKARKPPLFRRFDGKTKRSFRRLPVRHDTVDLGTDSLGRPATIRIVRELPLKPVPEEVREVQGPTTGAEELESLALAPPQTDASPEEVDAVIEKFKADFLALRPVEGVFTREQCVTVAKRLSDGLTYDQLAAYYKRHELKNTAVDINDLEHPYRSKLLTRARWVGSTSWFPGTAVTRLDKYLRNPVEPNAITTPQSKGTKKLSAKEQLVERILRRLWCVREKNEVKYGELDVLIQNPIHLGVLLKHSTDLFQAWSEKFGVRIEISEPEHIVRIAGPYQLTADVFSILVQSLQRIEKSTTVTSRGVPLSSFEGHEDSSQPAPRSRPFLDQVEHLTRTRIITKDRASTLHRDATQGVEIYFLGPHRTDLHDARRMIAQSMERKDPRKTHVQSDHRVGASTPTEVPIEAGSNLQLKERHLSWARWRYAESLQSQAETIDEVTSERLIYDPASSRALADAAAEHLVMAFDGFDAVEQDSTLHWRAAQEQQYAAFVGLLAHPASPRQENALHKVMRKTQATKSIQDTKIDHTFKSLIQQPRTLFPGVPDLWARLNAVVSAEPQSKHQLLIRLKPGKANPVPPGGLRVLPELELTFGIHERERTTFLQAVRLVRSWRESDLLLPAQATDIRFEARSLIPPSTNIDPRILEFAQSSKLDVFGDGRLQTPARMEILVPQFACESTPVSSEGASGSAKGGRHLQSSSPNELMVDYFFSSLEHRSSLTAAYQGHPFTFSLIEAGRTGGRHEELRFELHDLKPPGLVPSDVAVQQLYRDWFNNALEFNARLFK